MLRQVAHRDPLGSRVSPTNFSRVAGLTLSSSSDSHRREFDEGLIAAITRGDEAAFSTLFRCYASPILGFLINMLRDRELAEEVLQEVFLQVWRDASRFDPSRSAVRSWLFLLARSRATDSIRSAIARRRREEATAAESHRSPALDLESRFQARLTVQAALDHLSPEQQECVMLSFFEGLSLSQVSARLGIPLGTAKSRFLFGMRKLRDNFSVQDEGSSHV